jgi:hypothetical protein
LNVCVPKLGGSPYTGLCDLGMLGDGRIGDEEETYYLNTIRDYVLFTCAY